MNTMTVEGEIRRTELLASLDKMSSEAQQREADLESRGLDSEAAIYTLTRVFLKEARDTAQQFYAELQQANASPATQ
jgi:hypothetical protein